MGTKFQWKSLKGGINVGGIIILKWILKKYFVKLCTGLFSLRILTSGDLL
jgi:hypothetical protein